MLCAQAAAPTPTPILFFLEEEAWGKWAPNSFQGESGDRLLFASQICLHNKKWDDDKQQKSPFQTTWRKDQIKCNSRKNNFLGQTLSSRLPPAYCQTVCGLLPSAGGENEWVEAMTEPSQISSAITLLRKGKDIRKWSPITFFQELLWVLKNWYRMSQDRLMVHNATNVGEIKCPLSIETSPPPQSFFELCFAYTICKMGRCSAPAFQGCCDAK